jgi:hypothetical protein
MQIRDLSKYLKEAMEINQNKGETIQVKLTTMHCAELLQLVL